MSSYMEKELEILETSVQMKLQELRGPDQEEHKGQALLNKRLTQLRITLESASHRILQSVQQQARSILNPALSVQPQIEIILSRINRQKQTIKASPKTAKRKISQRMQSLQEFAEIEEKIKLLQIPSIPHANPQLLIKFDSEQIFEALQAVVTVDGYSQPNGTDQKCLIYQKGIINMISGIQTNIKPDFTVPKAHASLQHMGKLYICGGRRMKENVLEFLDSFFVSDVKGYCKMLQSMKEARECLSLTGSYDTLIGLGGFNGSVLNVAQHYNIGTNEWELLPSLNTKRQCPGSCILQKKLVFCFCGYKDFMNLNSIEYLDLDKQGSWTQLHVNEKVAKTQQIVALPFDNNIVVFGGTNSIGFSMYLFSEHGELICDLSTLPNIPGYMCQGIAVEEEGKIYAVGQRREWKEKFKAQVFDGMSWQQL